MPKAAYHSGTHDKHNRPQRDYRRSTGHGNDTERSTESPAIARHGGISSSDVLTTTGGPECKQGSHRPQTLSPVCKSLHRKVTDLRLGASATDHGLHGCMAAPSGWLAVPALHRHPCIWPVMCKYDVIHKTGSRLRDISQRRKRRTEQQT